MRNVIIYLNKKKHTCDCGAKVFLEKEKDEIICNKCSMTKVCEGKNLIDDTKEIIVKDSDYFEKQLQTVHATIIKGFSCSCKCNIFKKANDVEYGEIFVCNACGLEYQGEK